jgi:uncharacterized membrane protein YqiK
MKPWMIPVIVVLAVDLGLVVLLFIATLRLGHEVDAIAINHKKFWGERNQELRQDHQELTRDAGRGQK